MFEKEMNDICNSAFYTKEELTIYYKSSIKLGNVTMFSEKHFNWFQKLMWKICFNAEVKDLERK